MSPSSPSGWGGHVAVTPPQARETEAQSILVSAGGETGRVHPPPRGMEKSQGPGAGSWWLLRPPRRPRAVARKQWAVNSRRVAPLCRAMLRWGGKGRKKAGQRRNRTPVRRGLGTHVLPATIELPVGPWRALVSPGEAGRMLSASPVLRLFGVCCGRRRRKRRPGLGWEAPDTVPRAGGNRLFGELVTPPCPPRPGAGREPGQLRERRGARAQQHCKGEAVRRRARGGRLGVPARVPPGRGGLRSLAPGPGADGFGGCEKSNPDFLGVGRREPASSRCSGSSSPRGPPGMCCAGGAGTPTARQAPTGTWSVRLSIPPSIALFPLHPCPASLPAPAKHCRYPEHHPGRGARCYPHPPCSPSPSCPGKSQTHAGVALSRGARGSVRGTSQRGLRGDWRLPWAEKLPSGRWLPGCTR